MGDKTVACGNYSDFADYVLFLGYSGLILGHSFRRLQPDRTLLAVWGFHDGDMFLLGRMRPGNFTLLCR